MPSLKPRAVLLVAALALTSSLILACGGESGSRDKVKVGFFPAPATYAGFYAAADKGFYDDERIDVEFVPLFGERIAAAASGEVDFALDFIPNVMLAQEDETPVKIVAVKEAVNSIATASLKERAIRTPSDYEGHSFGSNPGSLEFELLPIMGRLNGFDASKVEIQELDFSVLLASLLSGDVDVVTAFYVSQAYSYEKAAKEAGKDLELIRWAEFGLDTYGDSIIASDTLLEENPDLVERFLRASFKGFAYAVEHSDEVPDIVRKFASTEEVDIIETNWARTVETLVDDASRERGLGWIDEAKLELTRSLVFDALGMEATLPLEDVYTNQFLPEEAITVSAP